MLAGFYGRVPRTPDEGVDQVPVESLQRLLGMNEELQCARPHFADVFSCKPLLHGS